MSSNADLTGLRRGRLLVVSQVVTPETTQRRKFWLCRCDCGAELTLITWKVRKRIRTTSVTGDNRVPSCGCYRLEQDRLRLTKHGAWKDPQRGELFHIWTGMNFRCSNPNAKGYEHYGGRGISVDPLWRHDFVAFERYINQNLGPRPNRKYSLDRIDVNGNYTCGNLRWATASQQLFNRRPPAVRCGVLGKRGPCKRPVAPDGGPCYFHVGRS